MNRTVVIFTTLFFLITGFLSPRLVNAQEGLVSAQGDIEEIIVTARKRAENLSEIPLAITVFSAEDIMESGFKTLEDLSLQVSGFQYSPQGGQAAGRANSQLRFRGMNVPSLSEDPSKNIATMFVDGIYVIGGYHSLPLEEIERIEIVKGPQSALYGRSTFGGAVNYITKDPNDEEVKGKVNLTVGEDGESIIYGSVEGPLNETFAVRVATKHYSRNGLYTARDGGAMGAEETKSLAGNLVAKGDNWRVKLRVFHSKDHDGPPAGGYVMGLRNDTCTGKTFTTNDPAYPTINPARYMCGKVPGPNEAIDYFGGTQTIDSNTKMDGTNEIGPLNSSTTAIEDKFANQPLPGSLEGKVPVLDYGEMGMKRTINRMSINSSFDLDNGMTLEASWGVNEMQAMWMRDFDYTGELNWTARDPYLSDDRTYDVKLMSSQEGKLRWLAGINRYEQDFVHRGQGGDAVAVCINSFGMPSPYFKCAPYLPPMLFLSSLDTGGGNNSDNVVSQGIYAAVDYDFNDQLTLSTEARAQREEISQFLVDPIAGRYTNTLTFENFLPRVILRYKQTDTSMFYGSYSVGVLPGRANDAIASADAYELEQYIAAEPKAGPFLDEEELDSMEFGWKGILLDGRATVSVAVYTADWANQKGRSTVALNETCRAGDEAATTYDCSAGIGTPRLVIETGELYTNTRNFDIMGDSKISGIEVEANIQVTDKLDLSMTLGMADSEYENYTFNFVKPFSGYQQMAGNTMPRYPEDMGSISATYKDSLDNGWDMFVRGDLNYFGKTMADESNLAYCDSYTLVNARGGVQKDNLRMELYVNNLTDEEAWSACSRWTDFATPNAFAQLVANQGVSTTPLRKRNFGLRISYDF